MFHNLSWFLRIRERATLHSSLLRGRDDSVYRDHVVFEQLFTHHPLWYTRAPSLQEANAFPVYNQVRRALWTRSDACIIPYPVCWTFPADITPCIILCSFRSQRVERQDTITVEVELRYKHWLQQHAHIKPSVLQRLNAVSCLLQ